MTGDIIENQWMTIGTDDKLYSHLSNGGRVKTGAKGIGRFALNRLGKKTEMQTFASETSKGYKWTVKWEDFDVKGASVSDVKAELVDHPDLNINDILSNLIHDFPAYDDNLKKEILHSPLFETGTIIKISDLNDFWSLEQLQKLYNNLEILLPPKEQSDFKIWLLSKNAPDDLGEVKGTYSDDYDYKLEANYKGDEKRTLYLTITRNELDAVLLKQRYKELLISRL